MGNRIILLFSISLFSILVIAQNDNKTKSSLDSVPDYKNSTLFNNDQVLKFDLKLNQKAVKKDVGDDRTYHWAKVIYMNENGDSVKLKIKVRTRGNFRRASSNCNFPQLKFKIPKKVRWDKNIFSGQSRLKLVVPCFKDKVRYEELVMKEYLAYKIYNLFTEQCYRVRLVHINLIDSLKNEKSLSFRGFFLEETDQMAKRNNGKTLKLTNFQQESINRQQMTHLAVYQYLIGNTDWSIAGLHNIKLLFVNNNNVPVAIPYDFDWCGFVNSPYAVPAPQIATSSVRIRVFRGYKRSLEEYEPVIKQFNDKKGEIYQLFENNQFLSEKEKKNTKNYFDEFYEIINEPKQIKYQFIKGARR